MDLPLHPWGLHQLLHSLVLFRQVFCFRISVKCYFCWNLRRVEGSFGHFQGSRVALEKLCAWAATISHLGLKLQEEVDVSVRRNYFALRCLDSSFETLTGFGPIVLKLGCLEHDSHVDELLQLVGFQPFNSAQCVVSSAHHDYLPNHQIIQPFDLLCRSLESLEQPMEQGYFLQIRRSRVGYQAKDLNHHLEYQRASLAYRKNPHQLSIHLPSIVIIEALLQLSFWPSSSWI